MAEKVTLEQEIGVVLGDLVQYDLDAMFPKRKGFGARGAVRSKLKLLKNLVPDLVTVLLDGERLVYVARGYVVNWVEQLFGGGTLAYYANITCVVLTDRRILLVNSSGAGKQKHYRNQIMYSEIADAKMKSFMSGATTLKFKDGKSLTIGGFRGKDRKQMQIYIPELIARMPAETPRVEKSVQYLCPRCPAIYIEQVKECSRCGTAFKSAEKAAKMSLFLPGLGDMYLGHRSLGLMELLGSLVQWFILVFAVRDALSGTEGGVSFLMVWLVIMLITNVIDYFLTRSMGRKGLIAVSKAKV